VTVERLLTIVIQDARVTSVPARKARSRDSTNI
jgi:hypothetical protein